MIVGWDFWAKEYRAVVADSNGSTSLFRGKIEGNKFTMMSDVTMMGQPAKIRFTQDHTDPKAIIWINEFSVNNGPWQLIEEYVVKPSE